ncbi:MAG TPA: STAS domain-containing protein [Polyangiaceae bacterium]|jgi:anti-anti-sigma factor|nr:STAS domain-containing protein [Polyangiaceae bacterium]
MVDAARRKNVRLLIVDDNESIHRDFRSILEKRGNPTELDQLEASIFGAAPAAAGSAETPTYELTFARQGEEALEKVRQAKEKSPYALAFVDMRMPPGWDGVETLSRLWEEQPSLQAVICSAYTEQSWEEITKRLGQTDRLLILKKPFDPIEVRQMAYALCEKWNQHAEAARSEAKNRALLDAIPDTILRIDKDGNVLDVKPARGRALDDAVRFAAGTNVRDAMPSKVADRIMLCAERAREDGVAQAFDYDACGEGLSELEVRVAGAGDGEAIVILRDITEKRRAERAAKDQAARDEVLRAQAEALSALTAPLIPITGDVVVMPLIGEMDAARLRRVQEALIEGVAARRARVAILDMTGVPSLDTQGTDEILRIARAARLLGSRVILTGIRPEVAQALVSLGHDLSGVVTRHSLQSGIAYALSRGS